MAYDEDLAERVRLALADAPGLAELKMFGGVCFMVAGHMACGVLGDELIVRLGPEAADEALGEPGVREFDFTGRPMRTMVVVAPSRVGDDESLAAWVGRARDFTAGLPPKVPKGRRRRS